MTELPEPPIAANVDLRDFAFMPLDVQRLRDSDLAALESPEACWAAVLLWCVSWHQVPAGSLPDDDRLLARFCGYQRAPRDWARIRPGAVRGWAKHSDGRLYHMTVVEKAADAWASKLQQRWRTECARIRKANQRHRTEVPEPTFEQWTSGSRPAQVTLDIEDLSHGTGIKVTELDASCPIDVPRETPSKGQGEGYKEEDIDLLLDQSRVGARLDAEVRAVRNCLSVKSPSGALASSAVVAFRVAQERCEPKSRPRAITLSREQLAIARGRNGQAS